MCLRSTLAILGTALDDFLFQPMDAAKIQIRNLNSCIRDSLLVYLLHTMKADLELLNEN